VSSEEHDRFQEPRDSVRGGFVDLGLHCAAIEASSTGCSGSDRAAGEKPTWKTIRPKMPTEDGRLPAACVADRPGSPVVHIRAVTTTEGNTHMIVLGLILFLIGYFTGISLLYTVGGIVLIVGVVFYILGTVGRPVGGRKVWF
jgi:hypothetical protein